MTIEDKVTEGLRAVFSLSLLGMFMWGLSAAVSAMPLWQPLFLDANSHIDYANTYAKNYRRYFVGVKQTGVPNDVWWRWSYNYRHQYDIEATNGFFMGVDSINDLRNACSRAYKGTMQTEGINKGKVTEDKIDEKLGHIVKYTERDIWLFCSPIGQKPTTISNDKSGYETGQVGSGSNKNRLISVKDELNDGFWKIRQEEFFEPSGEFSGSNAKEGGYFKKFYEENKDMWKDYRPLLKDKCAEAYLKTTPISDEDLTEEQIARFCVLELLESDKNP